MATQSQINASLGLPPGINPDGSWNAQDYMERRTAGQVDTQAQVDAARAANPYSAQNMAKVDVTRQGQYVDNPITGETVALTSYSPGFDINNKTALTYIGEGLARGGQDSTSQQFLAIATPAQKAEADRLWSIEKARLDEIDRVNALKAQQDALKTPTGLLTGQADLQTSKAVANPAALPKGFLEGIAAIPNVTDQQIVTAMKTANVSPKNLADGLGISEGEIIARVAGTVGNGETVQLGDTIIQPKYRVIGDGQDQQIGGLENVYTYRASDNKVGGGYTQYAADGTLERTGTQMKVNATQDFLKFALGATALFGAAALTGLSPQSIASIYGEGAMLGQGLTAAEALAAGLTPAQALAAGLTTAELTAAGYTAAQLAGTTTTGLLTGADVVATNVVADAATGLTASQLTTAAKLGLTAAQFGNLVSGGLGTAGNLLQMQQSREAAQKAQAMIEAETAAAKTAAQFRPVGMTTRFGTSEFKLDPKTGQLTSAGYTASPGVLEAQNRLVALGNKGLAQAEGAQEQFAPLQAGATSLFNLGSKYLAKTPEDVAKDYLASQMSLLQPSREIELANLQTKLRNQGRIGLSVAQGGDLGDTTPELQALYNARARQEAELAANAQLAGQRDVLFGAGLYDLGAKSLGNYYSGQQASYAPYTTALGQFTNLEQLAQQPLQMSATLGQQSAQAGANVGQLGLRGAGQSVALATGADATRNLAAQGLIAAGNPNAMFGQSIGGLLGGGLQSAFSGTGLGSSGFGTGLAYGNQDLGLFL